MAVQLESLLDKFENVRDFEFEGTKFQTHVPHVAPSAYFHIVYSALEANVQTELIDPLKLPDQVRAFYHEYNGARLFSGNLSIFGFWRPGGLLDRSDFRKLPPHNLIDANWTYTDNLAASPIVLLGFYHDGSHVLVERRTGHIYCTVGEKFERIRQQWKSFDDWLTDELGRLSDCFDGFGNRLVEIERLLPGSP